MRLIFSSSGSSKKYKVSMYLPSQTFGQRCLDDWAIKSEKLLLIQLNQWRINKNWDFVMEDTVVLYHVDY